MSKEEAIKKCVDCGQTGHTSTDCNNGKVGILMLFGVRIDPTADQRKDDDYEPINSDVPEDLGALSEPKSTEVLTTHNDENGYEPKRTEVLTTHNDENGYEPKRMEVLTTHNDENGYEPKRTEVLTTHNNENGSSIDLEDPSDEHGHDKKKGMPWTEDEHRLFLTGLDKLGKGHWRAISKQFVPSRTPTQVASHAQKFYIRMNSTEDKRKRRSSLFDMPSDEYSLALAGSVRPLAAPKARTYGVEGYNRCPDTIGYDRHDHIPLVKCAIEESVHPLDQRTERFATLMSRPLLITNGERNTQESEVDTKKD